MHAETSLPLTLNGKVVNGKLSVVNDCLAVQGDGQGLCTGNACPELGVPLNTDHRRSGNASQEDFEEL